MDSWLKDGCGASRKKRKNADGVCRIDGGDLGLSEVSEDPNFQQGSTAVF